MQCELPSLPSTRIPTTLRVMSVNRGSGQNAPSSIQLLDCILQFQPHSILCTLLPHHPDTLLLKYPLNIPPSVATPPICRITLKLYYQRSQLKNHIHTPTQNRLEGECGQLLLANVFRNSESTDPTVLSSSYSARMSRGASRAPRKRDGGPGSYTNDTRDRAYY